MGLFPWRQFNRLFVRANCMSPAPYNSRRLQVVGGEERPTRSCRHKISQTWTSFAFLCKCILFQRWTQCPPQLRNGRHYIIQLWIEFILITSILPAHSLWNSKIQCRTQHDYPISPHNNNNNAVIPTAHTNQVIRSALILIGFILIIVEIKFTAPRIDDNFIIITNK